MNQQLDTENRSMLANMATAISFPYIWIGLFLIFFILYGADFFGAGIGGSLVSVLICLGLLNPLVPGLVSGFVARPLFLNLLGREIVTGKGCLAGLATVVAGMAAMLFFLTRDPNTSLIIFAVAPLLGSLLAASISLLSRRGPSGSGGRRPPGPGRVGRQSRGSELPGGHRPPSLPPPSSTSRPVPPSKGAVGGDRPKAPRKPS